MRRLSYSIQGSEEILIKEEVYDSNGNCILLKDFQSNPVAENHMEYDSENRLIVDREISDGIELNRSETEYDSEGEFLRISMYFGDSIYEDQVWTRSEAGFTKVTEQDGIVIQRKEYDKLTNTSLFQIYENEELIEIQKVSFDPDTLITKTLVRDVANGTELVFLNYHNENNDSLGIEEFGPTGDLERSYKATYHEDLLESETMREFHFTDSSKTTYFSYDDSNNLVKSEIKTESGTLLSFHTRKYDELNRVIEEAGVRESASDVGFGSAELSGKFHIRIDYLD
jgi:hypothetical protein